ncbi:transposase [Sphingobium sp. CECT 9361]|uniref:transposase n=1 Tax=Sphingobium sp. CECT 9361 TaxID=2845384 RepID=UPI0033B43B7B
MAPGQGHDEQGFGPLFRMPGDRIEVLLTDKGYDADAIRVELAAAGLEAAIPVNSNRRLPQELAARRHPLRQHQGILSRLRRRRINQTLDILCPRRLVQTQLVQAAGTAKRRSRTEATCARCCQHSSRTRH